MKNSKKSKKWSFPKLPISIKKKDNHIDNSTILISGILLTCVLLSIASGFIDLTFFSGLSKSILHLATLPLPAAVLYTIISVGFISGKFWCAMQIGMIRELQTRLEAKGFEWASGLKRARFGWHIAHKFLIIVSIVTALSLSVNSIGAGIRNMEQNIKNMSADTTELIELKSSYKAGNVDVRAAKKENISGAKQAQETAAAEVARYAKRLKEYQSQYFQIADDLNLTDEEKAQKQNNIITKIVNEIPGVSRKRAIYFTEADLRESIQKVSSSNEILDSSSIYEEGIAFDMQQIESKIKALKHKNYKNPDGSLLVFEDSDGKPYDVDVVIGILQGSILKWQAPDAGDAGESSKIFTLVATYINADAKAGGMGVSEWIMIIFIFLAGIVQEYLIYLFTPKATIDRKLLSQVSHYMKWKNEEEKERFLISVYISYAGDGIINQERFEAKCKKAVYFMELKEDDIVAKYASKKEIASAKASEIKGKEYKEDNLPKPEPIEEGYSSNVDKAIKEIESIIGDKR